MVNKYKVFIIRNALKELKLIYNSNITGYNLIKKKIDMFSMNPYIKGVKKT